MYNTIWLVNSSPSFYLIISQHKFSNRKNSVVREEVSDFNKSLCKNILLVSSRLCTSSLVRSPPQLTLFTSPTTPSTPRNVRSRQFPTLEIWQSPDKFTGKHKTQINIYIYIYIRSLLLSAWLGWSYPPSQTNSSVPKKTTSGTADTYSKTIQAASPATPTATTATRPYPSKSKFSFARGGGGDFLIPPPSGATRIGGSLRLDTYPNPA